MVATVQMVEYTEALPGGRVSEFLHLMRDDAPSGLAKTYVASPIRPRSDGADAVSMERWIRFRFQPPFSQVFDFRFHVQALVVPPGWDLRFGTTSQFRSPSAATSLIARDPVPTSMPEAPNCGGVSPLDGDQERFTDFIVLQARVQDAAPVGPMLGFDALTNQARPLQYRFDWTET